MPRSEPTRRRRRWPRRLALAGLGLVLGLVGLLASVVGVVVSTDWGTRHALMFGLARYSGAIPGSMELGAVQGRLGQPMCIEELRLADARDRSLVEVDRACFRLVLGSLTDKALDLEYMQIQGARVHLYPGDPTWTDLAPDRPRPPTRFPGPDLPLRIEGHVFARDFALLRHDREGETTVIGAAGLSGELRAQGREATVALERVWAHLRPARQFITGRALVVAWNAPYASLDGEVHVDELGDASVRARVDVEDGLRAAAHVRARIRDYAPVDVEARAELRNEHRRVEVLASAGEARVTAALQDEQAEVFARLPGGWVEAQTTLVPGGPRHAVATVMVSDAKEVTAELDRLLPQEIPAVEAAGLVRASCALKPALRCEIRAEAERHQDRAAVRGLVARSGKATSIDLREFRGRVGGQPLWLARPARVELRPQQVAVSDLKVGVAGGTVGADGVFSTSGPSDLTVNIDQLRLATIADYVPRVRLQGRLDGEVRVRGRPQAPFVSVAVQGRDLAWGRQRLGRAEVQARLLAGRMAEAEATWHHQGAVVRAEALVPVTVDLDQRAFELSRSASAVARVDVDAFSLSTLEPWLGELDLRGTVDASVRAAGRLDDPSLVAHVDADRLAIRGGALGNADITVGYRDRRAHVALALAGGRVGEVGVRGSVPLRLEPRGGGVKYDRDGLHQVVVSLDGVKLSKLEPWVSKPELGGVVQGTVLATMDDGHPGGHVALFGYDLRVGKQSLGAAQVDATLHDHQATAHAMLSATRARLVEVVGRIPLDSHGPRGLPRLEAQMPLLAAVELRDFDLRTIAPVAETPMAGETNGHLYVGGTLEKPRLDSRLRVSDLGFRGKALGDLVAHVGYADDQVDVHLRHRRGSAYVRADVALPLEVSLDQERVQWHRERDHRVRVEVVGLDDELLRSFMEPPVDAGLLAHARIEAEGTLADLRATADVRASIDRPGAVPVAVHVRLDAEDDRQGLRVFVGGGGPTGLLVDADTEVDLEDLAAGRVDLVKIPIRASARADEFPLQALASFVPKIIHDADGVLHLSASMDGTVREPHLEGSLVINDAALTVVPLNQRFTDITVKGGFTGPDAELARLEARSGDGRLSGSAKLHVAPGETQGMLELYAHELPIIRPGLPLMQLDTHVQVDLDARGAMTKLDVGLRDSFVDVVAMSVIDAPAKLPEDDGVTFVDIQGKRARKTKKKESREPWIPRDLEVGIALVDPLRVRGPQADMAWTGKVRVTRAPGEKVQASGSFRSERGRVSLVGNEFELESGEVRMPEQGDLDPYIDMVATTTRDDVLVTMNIRGRVSRPILELRSDPSMEEPDIFALLVTGHADASEGDDTEFGAKAASVLAAFQNPALQRSLRENVGIDRVGVGFGEAVDQPIVTVGKHISRKVYVETQYHHNAPAQENRAEVRLEYMFKPPRWSVETAFGDAAQGEIGLWWKRRFGRPWVPDNEPKPKPESELADGGVDP